MALWKVIEINILNISVCPTNRQHQHLTPKSVIKQLFDYCMVSHGNIVHEAVVTFHNQVGVHITLCRFQVLSGLRNFSRSNPQSFNFYFVFVIFSKLLLKQIVLNPVQILFISCVKHTCTINFIFMSVILPQYELLFLPTFSIFGS